MINKNSKAYKSFIKKLTDRVYKILPLYEEKDQGLTVYVRSLIFELEGLPSVIDGSRDSEYISLMATLESIYDEFLLCDFDEIGSETHGLLRREVFKCANVVKKIGESITESGDY